MKRWAIRIGVGFIALLGVVFLVPTWRVVLLGILLGEPFHDSRPLSYWINEARHQDVSRRVHAAYALGYLGEKSKQDDALTVLKELLKDDPEPNVRARAALSMMVMGPSKAHPAVPALVEALKNDKTDVVRWAAAVDLGSLCKVGTEAQEQAVPALISALQSDESENVRARAAYALHEIGPRAKAAIPVLIEVGLIKSTESLGLLGIASLHATIASRNVAIFVTEDPNKTMREDLISPPFMAPVDRITVPFMAQVALSRMGPEAVQPLVQLLNSSDPQFRQRVSVSLTSIGAEAVPPLINELTNKDARVRQEVIMVFSFMGQEASAAVPALMKIMKDDEDASVRQTAALALQRIDPQATEKKDVP